ncbi:MAG: BlaI/MecI/CopY family transcriptional regulator [bacterium]|nr:BlaI/MecI/CopY family transcriptional regulator [bacterium]
MQSKVFPAAESELGPLQRDVLGYIWEHSGCTVRDCLDSFVEAGRDYAYTTIQTVFDALHRKRLVHRRRAKNAYRYEAAKSREGLLAQGMRELLTRFGNPEPVASSLVDALEGDPEEIKALVKELKERGHIK